MSERKYNTQNLRPPRKLSTEEARKLGSKGGKKSVKVRKEKKLMSQIYADILADQSGIKRGGGIRAVVQEILNDDDPRCRSAKVSLIKEIREGTEGNKLTTETTLSINADDSKVADILARHGISKTKD